ncbi:hypothetical protein GMOD_00009355 [Pyrenophora seminiperda CCB06]|uniref:Uncharacterized protein n=1 Tax=Pyrenophora seminiperda CCB06 TaxID=1302712 RepID=A0A3M7MGG4_9PLEO|nr:hypothetical protein GMOD_00009355 [Pyrenophora seminiperda CCB06]
MTAPLKAYAPGAVNEPSQREDREVDQIAPETERLKRVVDRRDPAYRRTEAVAAARDIPLFALRSALSSVDSDSQTVSRVSPGMRSV